jgi:hypothetical protein
MSRFGTYEKKEKRKLFIEQCGREFIFCSDVMKSDLPWWITHLMK